MGPLLLLWLNAPQPWLMMYYAVDLLINEAFMCTMGFIRLIRPFYLLMGI